MLASPVTWVSKNQDAKGQNESLGVLPTERYAHIWCCISSYFNSKRELGYSPLVAIQLALAGKMPLTWSSIMIGPREGVSSYIFYCRDFERVFICWATPPNSRIPFQAGP